MSSKENISGLKVHNLRRSQEVFMDVQIQIFRKFLIKLVSFYLQNKSPAQ